MDSHLKTFMASLRRMKENEVITDVTLKLPDGSTIPCHKLVLIAACPFFETMFQSGLKESTEQDVKLEFSDADTIRNLIEFIYSGKIDVNEDNVQTLVAASEFLFLDDLKAHCEDFMTSLIRSSNHQELCKFGEKFNLKNLCSSAREFNLSHFKEVVEMPAFETLTEEELLEVVSDDHLRTENEDIVFESVVRWVNADPDQRKETFPRIAPSIRFPFCTHETLYQVVGCEPLMWNPECFKLIAEAQQLHSGREHVQNARTTPRNSNNECLVRLYNDNHSCQKVCLEYTASIDEEPVQWEVNSLDFNSLLVKGKCSLSESGVVWVINDEVRMSVDLKSKKITTHPWKKPRIEMCAFFVDDTQILAFGGKGRDRYSSDTHFEYAETTNPTFEWSSGSRMPVEVYDAHLISLLGNVFVFGGYTSSNCSQPSQSTQKFSFATKTFSVCSSMPIRCANGQAVALNDKIYLVGGRERVCFCYDPAKDTWTVLSRPQISTSSSCAAVWKGKIILNAVNDRTGEIYNPDIDHWSLKENLFPEEMKQHPYKLLCTMLF